MVSARKRLKRWYWPDEKRFIQLIDEVFALEQV
jgi:hypothetical protein